MSFFCKKLVVKNLHDKTIALKRDVLVLNIPIVAI